MAATATIVDYGGSSAADYRDTIEIEYEVGYDPAPNDYFDALAQFQQAASVSRRARYVTNEPVDIYALSIQGKPLDPRNTKSNRWGWRVQFGPPPAGAPIKADGGGDGSNPGGEESGGYNMLPWEWAPEYNIEYYDSDRPIRTAKNVVTFPRGYGAAGQRPFGTDTVLTNTLGERLDETQMAIDRRPVLVISRNYQNLSDIVDLNEKFVDTANSTELQGFGVRTLRYQLTESTGRRVDNGVTYWPGVTRILVEKTTDLIIDNVGYEYWDEAKGELAPAKDSEGNRVAAPIYLKLDGTPSDVRTWIAYRYLEEEDYTELF
ncbi:MAG: hypothetical protein AAGJ46_06615 [Planctomycetota bacterium]